MGKFKYAKSSIQKLQSVHPKLRKVMMLAKEKAEIDFDISEGHRSPVKQNKIYQIGRTIAGKIKTYCDGYKHLSEHNYFPSKAVDIYAYNGTHADYSKEKMLYLSSVIKEAADELGVRITWGGDWTVEKDGLIDRPHYQIEGV